MYFLESAPNLLTNHSTNQAGQGYFLVLGIPMYPASGKSNTYAKKNQLIIIPLILRLILAG